MQGLLITVLDSYYSESLYGIQKLIDRTIHRIKHLSWEISDMVADVLTTEFFVISFFIGMVIGLLTIATGNPIWKIVDIFALIVVIIGFMAFIPTTNSQTTIEQAANQVSNLMLYFVNVVIPFLIGDAISSAGYTFVTGK